MDEPAGAEPMSAGARKYRFHLINAFSLSENSSFRLRA